MAYLFASSPASYAEEKLSNHLGSLSTLPLHLASTQTYTSQPRPTRANPILELALHELSSSRPLTPAKIVDVLRSLLKPRDQGVVAGYAVESEVDRLVEAELMARAVTMVWKEVIQALLEGALALEAERSWWDASLSSRRGVGIYLVQTLPHRIFRALPPASSLRSFRFPPAQALFRQPSAVLTSAITSPYTLTRREMLASRKTLTNARDTAARRIGILASQGPRWSGESGDTSAQSNGSSDLHGETSRIYSVVCDVLEIQVPAPTPSKRSRAANIAPSSPNSSASPAALLTVLNTHLPRACQGIRKTLSAQSRPSLLTRFWFPLLFLPPVLWTASSTVLRNREWMRSQIRNAKETIQGFVVQWVWEPLESIGRTMRGGGEGLGVAPTTVKSDQASLERMVMDLGRDYYKLSGPALESLGEKVRSGDMEEVLRVYEKELQSPVRNALLGSLVRTLLIQVQKTKTDLSLSLLSLDHLLRSQQLTFAFVGVAPSVLIFYGLGGWLRRVWRGEKRGKGRKRQYFNGLRDIERLLLTSPKHGEELSDRGRGLLIVSVSGMRSWAAGLSGSNREPFLDDLRMVEDPGLSRGDKLRVVDRIWRCWGTHGTLRT